MKNINRYVKFKCHLISLEKNQSKSSHDNQGGVSCGDPFQILNPSANENLLLKE